MKEILFNRIMMQQDSFQFSGDIVFRDWKVMLENI